jgi:hypothetical protein
LGSLAEHPKTRDLAAFLRFSVFSNGFQLEQRRNERKTIRVNKLADDRTGIVRLPIAKRSVAMLPIPSSLETFLRNYLKHYWKENPGKLLFPAPRK